MLFAVYAIPPEPTDTILIERMSNSVVISPGPNPDAPIIDENNNRLGGNTSGIVWPMQMSVIRNGRKDVLEQFNGYIVSNYKYSQLGLNGLPEDEYILQWVDFLGVEGVPAILISKVGAGIKIHNWGDPSHFGGCYGICRKFFLDRFQNGLIRAGAPGNWECTQSFINEIKDFYDKEAAQGNLTGAKFLFRTNRKIPGQDGFWIVSPGETITTH